MANTMTKAEYIADRAKYIAEAEKQVAAFNAATNTTAANQAETAAKSAVKSANECALRIFMLECIEAGAGKSAVDAAHAIMVSACERHTYKAHKIAITAASDEIRTAELVPVDKVIDLTKFNKTVLSAWFYRAELLTYLLTSDTASGIGYEGKKLTDCMALFKLSKEALDAPKLSKSSLKKAIPEIIGAMLGDSYKSKVLPIDTNYLLDKFVTGGKSMTVKVSSVKQVVALLCDIAHRAITDGSYTIIGKEIKPKSADKPAKKSEEKPAENPPVSESAPKAKSAKSAKAA